MVNYKQQYNVRDLNVDLVHIYQRLDTMQNYEHVARDPTNSLEISRHAFYKFNLASLKNSILISRTF